MGEKIKRNASMKSAHFLILIRIFSIVRKDKASCLLMDIVAYFESEQEQRESLPSGKTTVLVP